MRVVDSYGIDKLLKKYFCLLDQVLARVYARLSAPAFAAKFYFMAAFPLAIVLLTLYAPIQSPDEASHLTRAYIIAHGQLGVSSQEGVSGGMVDVNLKKYFNSFRGVAFHPDQKISSKAMGYAGSLRWSDEKEFTQIHGAMLYPPLIYAPQAIALRTGELIGLSIAQTYTLVKFVNICFIILSCSILIYLLPLGRELVVAISLLPMALTQVTTSVIEGEILVLMLITLVNFCKGVDLKSPWTWKDSWASWLILALLIGARPAFLPVVIMFLYILIVRKSYHDVLSMFFSMSLVIAWMAYAFSSSGEVMGSRMMDTPGHLSNFFSEPAIFFNLVSDTLLNTEYTNFYHRSFIGILGWLDTPLPNGLYSMYTAIIGGAIVAAGMNRGNLSYKSTLLVFIVLMLICLSVFFILWATFNDVGVHFIGGIQGRYFNAISLLICLIIGGKLYRSNVIYMLCWAGIVFEALLNYYELPKILLFRYWVQ